MMRPAAPGDEARMEQFLAAHAESSMFLRGNLEAHGLGPSEHPYATQYWLWLSGEDILAVFGLSANGAAMCQCPGREPEAMATIARIWRGRTINILTGEAGQSEALLRALALWYRLRVNHVEPLYLLDLSRLRGQGEEVRRARDGDQALLAGWFEAYERDLGFAAETEAEARRSALHRAEEACRIGSPVRLLLSQGHPVAMAALNAQAGDMVQLGGVYVPQGHRNAGLGRRISRGVLAEARNNGAQLAVLFANNPAAARAYEALGFRQVGHYRIAIPYAPRENAPEAREGATA